MNYEELYRVVMDMRSYIVDPCAPPYWPHDIDDDQPPPPPPALPLF